MILEKINRTTEKLKPSFTKSILSNPDVLAYSGTLHWKYGIIPIDKASDNFALIHKKFYISRFFLKLGSITTSNPVQHIQKQTFQKMILSKIIKTIIENLIFEGQSKIVLYL